MHTQQRTWATASEHEESLLLTHVAVVGLLPRQVAHPTRCKQASKVRSWD